MLFTSEYSMKMPIGEALAVSLIGIATVMIILAVIACLIIVGFHRNRDVGLFGVINQV